MHEVIKMDCETTLCIYWQQGRCCLDEISIDSRGHCQDCIYVTIEEKELYQKRQELLKKYFIEEQKFD